MNGKMEGTIVRAVETRVSWGAVFAGVVIVLIAQVTLAMLGLGIGLSTINPATEQNPMVGLGTGSIVWWLIVSIVSLFFGGWVTSRLAGIQSSMSGVLHGLVTWGISMLLMVFLFASTVGAVVSGGLGLIQNAARVSGQVLSAVPGAAQQLQQQAQQQIQQQQQQPPATPQQQQQREAQVRQSAQQVASAAAAASLGSFFLLLIGGIAAAVGGALGRTRGPVRV